MGHPVYVLEHVLGSFEEQVFEEISELEFNCQEGEVIQALDLVIAMMYPGESDEFIADPELAYGKMGLSPHLPPNAAVHYEVKLLEHKTTSVSPTDLELPERKAIGKRKKDRGNFWYSRCDFSMSVQCYR
jgi:FK506-binding protein 8